MIREYDLCLDCNMLNLKLPLENVKKGRSDRPEVDVIIIDSGELEIEYETDDEGNQVPLHAEL